jgi:nucleoside-diphosphate-sugar epimerase
MRLNGLWIIKGYALTFGLKYVIHRYATIYGPGMRPALGMHVFFRQALQGEAITVHGDGSQDRTLTYIDDLVDGIVSPLTSDENRAQAIGQVFNLTAQMAVSARQMAYDIRDLVAERTGKAPAEVTFIEQRENQTMHEDFDIEKANTLVGWSAQTLWHDGLEKTYQWMLTQI